MWKPLRGLIALTFTSLLVTAAAADGPPNWGGPFPGPAIYDITHFDVLPVTSPYDSEAIAYPALFAFRNASESQTGNESFRIVNWLAATNHSFIVDVWKSLSDFEAHLAQPASVAFRFAVQDLPPPDTGCCIGSPIDDRQYTLVASFGTPWVSSQIPTTVGTGSALFVIIYVDLLVDGNPLRGTSEVVQYGAASKSANIGHLLSFSVLQQLDRPGRLVMLEVWDTMADYNAWDTNATTTNFVTQITPVLGSPLDYRLNDLCGSTYVTGTGCVPP
jgi:quinol monooxygenase YgiN